MEEIMTVSTELIEEANKVSAEREAIKAYLKDHGVDRDKFTITKHDAFLGYVSEHAIIGYLEKRYGDRLKIEKWSDDYDMERIRSAVENNDGRTAEVNYVKKYFYDIYDLKIIERTSGKSVCVDVKTAETKYKPNNTWTFLYPVVQNQRVGKDCAILCYYCKWNDGVKIILVGYMKEKDISKYKIVPAGSKSRRNVVSQIDNYETEVADYQPLVAMLNTYLR